MRANRIHFVWIYSECLLVDCEPPGPNEITLQAYMRYWNLYDSYNEQVNLLLLMRSLRSPLIAMQKSIAVF